MATKYGKAAYEYWAKKTTKRKTIIVALAMIVFICLAIWFN